MVKGRKMLVNRTLLDGGSNGYLMTSAVAEALGVEVIPSAVTLNMANGQYSAVGTTPPIEISYGSGLHEITTKHCFLVVPALASSAYDLLLGNVDMMLYHGIHNMGQGVLELFAEGTDGFSTVIPIEARPTRVR